MALRGPSGSGGGGSGLTALTGDVVASGSGSQTAFFVGQTAVITPASFSTAQNNYSPTGWLSGGVQKANVIRFTATAYTDITGLVPPTLAEGSIVTLENAAAATFPIRLVANSANSSAANRFQFASNVFLPPGMSLTLEYDATQSAWRELTQHRDLQVGYFGSGQDGNVTISSGTTTLSRDMFYQNLTLSGTGVLVTAGFRVFVSEMLDLSAAQIGAITCTGAVGAVGTGAGGAGGAGAGGSNGTNSTLGAGGAAAGGGAGSATNGSNGSAQAGASPMLNPQTAAISGAAGAGGTGSAGVAGSNTGNTQASFSYGYTLLPVVVISGVVDIIRPSIGGAGGGGGGGDGVNSGGGGGGGGGSGGSLSIYARFINRGSNTNAAIIQVRGGNGGAGGTPTAGNAGGGGGGSGGGGGQLLIFYGGIYGSAITDALDVTGGTGGAGGALHGTGAAANGNGGGGGPGGYIMQLNLTTGAVSEFIGAARTAPATGGTTTGVAGTSAQANL